MEELLLRGAGGFGVLAILSVELIVTAVTFEAGWTFVGSEVIVYGRAEILQRIVRYLFGRKK